MYQKKTFRFLKCGRVYLLTALLSMCMTAAFAQTTVKGKVIDETGETLIGVNVVEKGTTNGSITDLDGNFSVTVNNGEKAILSFSYIGYTSIEKPVKGKTQINVTLHSSAINLGEVVAIGYGTQTRKEITGSVANIGEEEFNQGVTRTASDLLQGKVAGLNISSGSGDVSSSPQMRLRGTSTLQNDQGPMVVIDGIPGGDMNEVAPSDIESISVLKDASSAAIYGSRSASGVILITTKRGSGSKTAITYNGYVAASTLANKPDLLTASEWRSMAPAEDQATFDRYDGADTDWFDEMTRTGISTDHNISMSGGSSNSNYRASADYLKNDGVVRDNSMERFNFRFQFQQRAINNRLRIGLTGVATIMDYAPAETGNFVLAYNMLPVQPVYNADGSWYENVEYDKGNVVNSQDSNTNQWEGSRFYGSADVQFDITSDWKVKGLFYKRRMIGSQSLYYDSGTDQGRDQGGYAERSERKTDNQMMELTTTYEKTFNDIHKLNAMGGYSWEENESSAFSAANRAFSTDMLEADNLQSGQDLRPDDISSSRNMYRLISFFGRVNYSYQEKYMATVTVRRDGSSKFGANNKWGTFPSASVAWGITEEDFMQDVNWVNDLKLRVGYGVTGNQAGLDPYKTLELYGASGQYYDAGKWLTAYKINQNANPDLKWEETSMLNIGLDFGLFNSRLAGTIEWYNKKTSDMLYTYEVPSPPYLYNEMMANVGDMKNTGIELSLNYDAIKTKDFTWKTTLNLSHNKNEITKLSNDQFTKDRVLTGDAWIRGGSSSYTHIVEEGRPLGQFYGWECTGITDGVYDFVDQNGDGSITDDDRTYIGDSQPDLIYGWSNNFTYKNFDLSVFVRGTIGNDVFNMQKMAYCNPGNLWGSNVMNDPLTFELKQVPTYSSYYIENGSFLRLDNITLGYTLDTDNINWLSKLRFYVTGQNLFVITGYEGLDPETDMNASNGLAPGVEDRLFYPKARTMTFGVNVSF